MKRINILPALLLLLLAFAVCNSCNLRGNSTADGIQLGLLSVFSGDGANYGEAARTGVDLALEEINAGGGINGKKITMIYEDDRGETKDAVSGFQKLASVDKVPVVIGPFYSGQVLACAPEADRSGTVLMTGSGTSDNIMKAGEYVFRTCPTNEEQGRTIARFCIDSLKKKTAFIIYRNADYGLTLKDRFKEQYIHDGGSVLGEIAIDADAKDARPQLIKAKESAAEVVFIPVHYPEGGVILKQAKELGLNALFIGGDGGFDPALINIAGNAADGSYWATIGWGGQGTVAITAQFKAAYKKKYNKDAGVYSGLYYDAMMVVAAALKNVSGDITGASVKEALLKIRDYRGPTGAITFNKDGDVEKPFSIFLVNGGAFQPVNY